MTVSEVNKELFEAHMKTIHKTLERLDSNVAKLFERQDEMNVTLAKNTVTVKEHHMRSVRLEEIQDETIASLRRVADEVKTIELAVKDIEEDFEPVKAHVTKLDKSISFILDLPKSIKFVFFFITLFLVIIGLYNGTTTLGQIFKMLK